MNITCKTRLASVTLLCIFFMFMANSQGQGSMQLVYFQPSNVSGSCVSASNCTSNSLCYLLRYTPAYTGVVTSYTTGFFGTCVAGNNPYLSASSCTMTNNSGVLNACASFGLVLFNLSGNSGGLPVTAGVPVNIHQVCFNLGPGQQTTITKDDITDLTVSIDLTGGGGPQNDIANFAPRVLSHNIDCLALPVQFISFEANKVNKQVLLSWVTGSEMNNDYFDIEWSSDGVIFDTVGQLDGQGNSKQNLSYSFLHRNPINGNNYYRLKQVDLDGNFSFSDVKYVAFHENNATFSLNIYPNPTSGDILNLTLSNEPSVGEISLQIIDLSGKIIRSQKMEYISDNFQIDIEHMERGTYILNVITASESYFNKFVKL